MFFSNWQYQWNRFMHGQYKDVFLSSFYSLFQPFQRIKRCFIWEKLAISQQITFIKCLMTWKIVW